MICWREHFGITEEKRNAPDTGKSDEGKDYTADKASLTAEEPAYNIKLEKTDAAPVYGSYNHE